MYRHPANPYKHPSYFVTPTSIHSNASSACVLWTPISFCRRLPQSIQMSSVPVSCGAQAEADRCAWIRRHVCYRRGSLRSRDSLRRRRRHGSVGHVVVYSPVRTCAYTLSLRACALRLQPCAQLHMVYSNSIPVYGL